MDAGMLYTDQWPEKPDKNVLVLVADTKTSAEWRVGGEWMDGWVGGWMDWWVSRWMGEWMGGWMDGSVNGWIGGWMDGWVVCSSE